MSIAAAFGFLLVCGAIAGMFSPGFRRWNYDPYTKRYYKDPEQPKRTKTGTNIYIERSQIYIGDQTINEFKELE